VSKILNTSWNKKKKIHPRRSSDRNVRAER
jgi:hypothetical protein